MHRIDGPGSVEGRFTEGNPAAGQRATQVTAAWLNDVQEGLSYIVEETGGALVKGRASQLFDAVVALAGGAVGAGDGSVPTSRQILTEGLATGGGGLAVDRTIAVGKASAAEVAAGTRDDVAVTPLGLAGGAGARLLQGNGYATLYGILFQWGTATVGSNGTTTIVLPTAFPQQCVFADFNGPTILNAAQDNNPAVSGVSASAISVYYSGRDGARFGRYWALGF